MNNIMVDNWFMEEVIADIHENKLYKSKSYADLLMAIILWDDVYYPQNSYNWWNSIPSQVQNLLYPIDDKVEEGLQESVRLLYRYNNITEEDQRWAEWKNIHNTESDIIISGAVRYMMLSSNNGCDYLPCLKE